jgi:hypothetical protein
MSQREIRPAANGTDTKPSTISTTSERWKLCVQHGGQAKRRSACRDCQAQYNRGWYHKNRERILAQQRQYHAANPGVAWAKNHRKRARRYGLTLITDVISREDVISRWGDRCHYCETGLFEEIDHIIPVRAGGHHQLQNVVPCCRACKTEKQWTTDALLIRRFRDAHRVDADSGPSVTASRS